MQGSAFLFNKMFVHLFLGEENKAVLVVKWRAVRNDRRLLKVDLNTRLSRLDRLKTEANSNLKGVAKKCMKDEQGNEKKDGV